MQGETAVVWDMTACSVGKRLTMFRRNILPPSSGYKFLKIETACPSATGLHILTAGFTRRALKITNFVQFQHLFHLARRAPSWYHLVFVNIRSGRLFAFLKPTWN
jgi:hypothetical protein